jgi:hypothetical protein
MIFFILSISVKRIFYKISSKTNLLKISKLHKHLKTFKFLFQTKLLLEFCFKNRDILCLINEKNFCIAELWNNFLKQSKHKRT